MSSTMPHAGSTKSMDRQGGFYRYLFMPPGQQVLKHKCSYVIRQTKAGVWGCPPRKSSSHGTMIVGMREVREQKMKTPADCSNLSDVRTEIDRIDREIVALIGQRAAYFAAAVPFKTDE